MLTEMMPWGLTGAQTLFLGGGLIVVIAIWWIIQYVVQVGKTLFSIGLMILSGSACCIATLLLLSNNA